MPYILNAKVKKLFHYFPFYYKFFHNTLFFFSFVEKVKFRHEN